VTVQYNTASSSAFSVTVATAVPGLFALGASGSGAGAVFNLNESTGELTLNSETNQALKSSTIWLFATGAGVTTPAGADGMPGSAEVAYTSPAATVTIGGTDVVPDYFGHAPGLVSGMLLVKAKIPASIASGRTVPVILSIGGATSQSAVTIAVK
jgi:uncharacterized protein (TIGR03437 family)